MKIKKYFILVVLLGSIFLLGGCSMLTDDKGSINDDNSYKAIFLKGIEQKYHKTFKIIRYQDSGYFWAEFEDKNGIKATGIYNVNGDTFLNKVLNSSNYKDDTYYECYFNEKAKKILEPILKDEPIDHYYLSVDNPCGSTKTDLSISLNDYFILNGADNWIDIILPSGKTIDEYSKITYDIYNKLITKQSMPFELTVYANGLEVYGVHFIKDKDYNSEVSYEEINADVDVNLNGAGGEMPDEKYLTQAEKFSEYHEWYKIYPDKDGKFYKGNE